MIIENQTIAAIGTKPGEAAIGIVRLSGNSAVEILEKVFKPTNKKKISEMETFTMAHGFIVDSKSEPIDQVIVSIMRKPKSYTREDVVEINCHGGLIATEKVMELCLNQGARLAEPGEFTKRAFLNGRIDLSQAEAVIEIVRAKTSQSLKVAAHNLGGSIREKIIDLRKRLLEILVNLEAAIDFIEEDLEITPYKKLAAETTKIYDAIVVLIKDEKKGEILKNGIKVAIIGKPNVGKSSLLNAIAKKEKAIVTHIPGTTRDAIEEILYVEGIPLIIIDTAGIRKARNIIEKKGVKKSLDYIREADLILLVIDSSIPVDEVDEEIISKISGEKTIVCINKVDLPMKVKRQKIKEKYGLDNFVEISATQGEGLEDLEDRIRKTILGNEDLDIGTRIIVNRRHRKILEDVKALIENAITAMKGEMSEEFPSSDLKIAYEMMGEILGETNNDDIINGIFSKFCIGK
jgi:tRNA modification GTPase